MPFKATVTDKEGNQIAERTFVEATDAREWFQQVQKEGYLASINEMTEIDAEALAQEKLNEDNRDQKIVSLEQYVGKSLTLSEQKFVVETLLKLLFDPSSTFAKALILLLSHKKQT